MGVNSLTECGVSCGCGGDMLPHDPHCALNFHYGMLLGAEDLRVEQGFHVGKARRHNHSLHGVGVAWGMGVSHDAAKGEIEVAAGMAVDGLGRELVLDTANCLSLPAWWQAHLDEPELADQAENNIVEFDAEVVACYSTCLSRPVPAIAQTCAGENSGTAYSRLCEAVCLSLRVVKDKVATQPAPVDYHRLRLLLGLDAVATDEQGNPIQADVDLLAQSDALADLPTDGQSAAAQTLWHDAAVADALDRNNTPAVVPTTIDDEGCIVLAKLSGVKLTRTENGWDSEVTSVDNNVRPVLLPTSILQDFYAALLPVVFAGQQTAVQPMALRAVIRAVSLPPATSGPRVLADSIAQSGDKLSFATDQPLHAASVKKDAFELSEFTERGGWSKVGIKSVKPDKDGKTITLTLAETPAVTVGAVLRLVARGSGDRPLMGKNLKPLAGASGSGSDFVYMISGDRP